MFALSDHTAEGRREGDQNGTWPADPQLAEKGCWSLLLQSPGAHIHPHHCEVELERHRKRANGKHAENGGRGRTGAGFIN